METYTLNNEMNISIPEGFRQMSAEERSRLNFIKDGEGECFTDTERHMILSIAWKKAGFAGLLVNTKEAAESMEKQTAGPMAPYGYKNEGFFSRDIGGNESRGFCYSYEAQGTAMSGESMIVKNGKTFYYLHAYMRTALKEESEAVVKEILDGISWK